MGGFVTKQAERRKSLSSEKQILSDLLSCEGQDFPGCDYRPTDRKIWMSELDLQKLHVKQIVWPGTHDSATNKIGIPFITRPFARCQSISIYNQLVMGARVLDIRVGEDRRVYHGVLATYNVDVAFAGVKKFLSETESEIILLEIRTEFGKKDPPDFDKYIVDKLGEDVLIHQDNAVFDKTVAELLPRRVICVWKPRNSPAPKHGDPLWSTGYLKDDWTDTDLPKTKFDNNMTHLSRQTPVGSRKLFYRVENTATPQADNPVLCVWPVTRRIHSYARMFISQAFAKGYADRLQVFSSDFITGDFVDACAGVTHHRIQSNV